MIFAFMNALSVQAWAFRARIALATEDQLGAIAFVGVWPRYPTLLRDDE